MVAMFPFVKIYSELKKDFKKMSYLPPTEFDSLFVRQNIFTRVSMTN